MKFPKLNWLLLVICVYCNIQTVFSQAYKRICVMGSSTAYGFFGSPAVYPRDSAWAFKLKKYYKDAGVIDTLFNIAINGIDCYTTMPTSYIPPAGRNLPDPSYNISKAVKLLPKPDVIIVNLPTNNYDWLDPYEVINCLKVIRDTAVMNNIRCFITTTQPRDQFAPSQRLRLKELRRLIDSTFNVWSINFWDDIVVDPPITIRPEYAFGDGIHLNPVGHTVLTNIVINKNIFSGILPVQFSDLTAKKDGNNVILYWKTVQEIDTRNYLVERSSDGISFSNIAAVLPKHNSIFNNQYSFTDHQPYAGYNYYRVVAVNNTGGKQYSSVAMIRNTTSFSLIAGISPSFANNSISVMLRSASPVNTQLSVVDANGRIVYSARIGLRNEISYIIDISSYPPGVYFVEALTGDQRDVRKFVKQ